MNLENPEAPLTKLEVLPSCSLGAERTLHLSTPEHGLGDIWEDLEG